MPWVERVVPARMERVAVVAPTANLRAVLEVVADAGVVEPEVFDGEASDLVAPGGIDRVAHSSIGRGLVSAVVGWSPSADVPDLRRRLEACGGSVVVLPVPPGTDPPTLLSTGGASGAFQRLVDTYTTVPYADLNPSALAGLAYVTMFGMMFGDVGHGVMLVALGLLLHRGRPAPLAKMRWAAPFVVGAGLTSTAFGLAYGEAFGPTGLVPTLWLRPLDHATTLLVVAIAAGAVLLAAAYALGTYNRWREGGAVPSLVALSGGSGVSLYAGLGLVGLGWFIHAVALGVLGACLVGAGLVLGFTGVFAQSGGRVSGAVQAGVEAFDATVRLGANTVSFARLAAFGMTHAALVGLVWSGTMALWHHGPQLWFPAVVLLVVGNAVAFALEGLVAGVQALRLEYYELFSRVFVGQGRAFHPWHLRVLGSKEA